MLQRALGRSGLKVSIVGLGCNNFGGRLDAEGTRAVIHKALDAGITLFDTADSYGGRGASEALMGEILGDRRKDIVLATKCGLDVTGSGRPADTSRRYIMSALEASLKRLKTDWIDLYQMHRFDPATPVDETLRALEDCVRQGKVRYVGCSNWAGWQVADADWMARELGTGRFITAQDEYSLLERGIESELVPALRHFGLGLLPYYPLAAGVLTGKYAGGEKPEGTRLAKNAQMSSRHLTPRNVRVADALNAFARERGHTLLELAFSWLAAQPVVSSVIAGATKPEQIDANVHAASWLLSVEDLAQIDAISRG
jgi:aryl-alcohol dehydrogenase-like predicted oxidoreductase